MKKKVLILSYYWPPSGGAGVQRWVKLTKYLSSLDVECHVLTVDPRYASYTSFDTSLQDDIAPEVKVHTTKSFDPLTWYGRLVGRDKIPAGGFSNVNTKSWKFKWMARIRSHLFIPDPRVGWNRYAFKKAKEIIEREGIQTVLTTSPPHSTQLIGLSLKRWKPTLKWIVDLRDPWTDIYYYDLLGHSKWSHKKNLALEKAVLEECDQLVTVGKGMKQLMESKGIIGSKVNVIYNGFDHEDFINLTKHSSKTISIVYTGTMAASYKPQMLFEVLAKLKSDHDFELVFIGQVDELVINDSNKYDLPIKFIATIPHKEVNQEQVNADLLLLIIPHTSNEREIITGKLFEYLATDNPILCIGPKDGDAAAIIKEEDRGMTFERTEAVALHKWLLQFFENYPRSQPSKRAIHSRENQAKELYQLI